MKPLEDIARQWDGKPSLPADYEQTYDFIARKPHPQAGKAAPAIARCLRAIALFEDPRAGNDLAPDQAEYCAELGLAFLSRPGLGRPALRLLTACVFGRRGEPRTGCARDAALHVASILDDPSHGRKIIKPSQRLAGEMAILRGLGPETPRGRQAILNSLLLLRWDRLMIPIAKRRDYLETISDSAAAIGDPDLLKRTAGCRHVSRPSCRASEPQVGTRGNRLPARMIPDMRDFMVA